MTREDILKMEAGPELDALVAEKVMGFEVMQVFNTHEPVIINPIDDDDLPPEPVPRYSTEISAL